jgi:SnoaL-like domain
MRLQDRGAASRLRRLSGDYRSLVPSPDVHAAIARLTFDYARGIDDRDWVTFRSVFADTCEVDFRSWSGAPAATMASDVWVHAVRSVMGGFDATQHLMTNLRLEPVASGVVVGINEAQAQHWFEADTMTSFGRPAEPAWCTLGGTFTNQYADTGDGWRIAACRFTLRWRTGDDSLFALARQRQ